FDLFKYVQPRVTADKAIQHPILKAEVEEDFPIALYQGGKSPTPTPMPPLDDGFAYDVFISYRQKSEKTWVRKTLVPQLEATGLRVFVDYRDFRLGAPLIKEMERAVVTSRYTLAVLSPAYLESNFTEFENLIAEHLGLEQSQRRLLMVMREDCEPRLGLRSRLWLDMTDDEEVEMNMARLTQELRLSPEAP
ncbi:toll/interleukin-1 receptor domain-containing protein, partial [filamentous cyanobacterium LEGE 11480]